MRFLIALVITRIALSLPLELEERDIDRTGVTENQFSSSCSCTKVIFVWARGTAEMGNMGTIIGQPLGDELRKQYNQNLMIEGIDYAALVETNFLPGGTDPASASLMRSTMQNINARCPDSVMLVGGYSQGAAVVHRSIENLAQPIKNQIAGVVTFGDTQRVADHDQIPNFPKDRFKIFCGDAVRDEVCDGNLTAALQAPHLSYGKDAGAAAMFLIGKASKVLGR